MDHSDKSIDLTPGDYESGPLGSRLLALGAAVGLTALAAGFLLGVSRQDGLVRFWQSWLLNYVYFLSVAMGALFFVVISSLGRMSWGLAARRLGEFTASNMFLMLVLLVPILLNLPKLYEWADPEVVAHDALLRHKQPWLNPAAFSIRCVFYLALWTGIAWFYSSRSQSQDKTGDVNLTVGMQKFSAPAVILGALSFTFASFDLVMSLDPHWFSTIFGVYFFSGCCVAFFSFVILFAQRLQTTGKLGPAMNVEHYHDLGKFLFGFLFFWGYLGFSQFLLIWYANMPEETVWFKHRAEGGWFKLSMLLLFGHLFIPWLGLLVNHVKRNRAALAFWAVWMGAMHWVDLYWLMAPEFAKAPGTVPLDILDFVLFVGMGGLFVAGLGFTIRGKNLAPIKDPRLQDSLKFKNAPY